MATSGRVISYTLCCTGAAGRCVEVKAGPRADSGTGDDERIQVNGDFVEPASPTLAQGELAARS
jgi:hypothetical protein